MQKDLKLYNIKGLLIFFVVMGHYLLICNSGLDNIVVFIYAFHMPAFILLSGFFSKNPSVRKIINLALLYIIFQTLFCIIRYLAGEYTHLQFTYGTPHFHLWYIVSLGSWYVVALFLKKVRINQFIKLIIVLFLIILGFVSRYYAEDIVNALKPYLSSINTQTLSWVRTFSFMPFFLIGYFMSEKQMKIVYSTFNGIKNKAIVIIPIVALILFIISKHTLDYEQLFFGFQPYARFSIWPYAFIVTFHYVMAIFCVYLLLNIVNNKESVLTKWGQNSLVIFLFHPIFMFFIRSNPSLLEKFTKLHPDIRFFVVVTIVILITSLFGSSWFNKSVKYIVNPYNTIRLIFTHK